MSGNKFSLLNKPIKIIVDEPRDRFFVLSFISGAVTAFKSSTRELLNHINIACQSEVIALNPTNGDLYILDHSLGELVVIKSGTWSDRSKLPSGVIRLVVGRQPTSMVVDAAKNFIYVSNFGDNTISIIDANSAMPTKTIGTDPHPLQIYISHDDNAVYTVHLPDYLLQLLNCNTWKRVTSTVLPFTPDHFLEDTNRKLIYAAAYDSNSIIRIEKSRFLPQEITVGPSIGGLTLDKDTGVLYVSVFIGNKLVKITHLGRIVSALDLPDGSFPSQATLNDTGSTLYLPLNGLGKIAVIDTQTMQLADILQSGTNTDRAVFNSLTDEIYCVNPESDTLTIIKNSNRAVSFLPKDKNPQEIVKRAGPWFDYPTSIELNTKDNLAYIINSTGGFLTVVGGTEDRPLKITDVGRNPRAAIYLYELNKLYVTSGDDNIVSVLDENASAVQKQITVGQKPRTMRYYAPKNFLFVINQDSNSISVIDCQNNEVINTMGVGRTPRGVAVTPNSSRLTVINHADSSLSIVDTDKLKELDRLKIPGMVCGLAASAYDDRVFMLLYSPSALIVVNTRTAKLEKIDYLKGEAAFFAQTINGLVVGQNFKRRGAELILVNPYSLEREATLKLNFSLPRTGTMPVIKSLNQVLFFDLDSRKRIYTFSLNAQSINSVAISHLVINDLVANQKTNQVYLLHSRDNAISVLDPKLRFSPRVIGNFSM